MVKKSNQQAKFYCHECGCELTENNSRESTNSVSGRSFLCIDCENNFFLRLENTEGRYVALFHTAAALDFPLFPLLLDGTDFDTCDEPYKCYIKLLLESGENYKSNKLLGFSDGITALQDLFGKEISHKDFAARIAHEKAKIAKQCGTKIQRERWGVEPLYFPKDTRTPKLLMTQAVYDELDRIYTNKVEELKGTTITPQIEFTLEEVAKSMVIFAHQRRYGEMNADKTWKVIDGMLASEELRKKDEKPIANFTPDAWINAFEKAGLMQDGQFLTLPEIEDAMIKIMRGKGYDQTLDAAHQLELNIINNARRNADQQTIFELPEDMEIRDELGEFATEESSEEKSAKEYGHLTTVRFERAEKPKKKTKKGEGKH